MLFFGFGLGVMLSSDFSIWDFAGSGSATNTKNKNPTSSTAASPVQSTPDPTNNVSPMPTHAPTGTPDLTLDRTPYPTPDPTPDPTPNPTPDPTPDPTTSPASKDSTSPPPTSNPTTPPDDTKTSSSAESYVDYGATYYPIPSLVVKPDPPLSQQRENDLSKEWGKWDFVDKKKDERPGNDYCGEFPNRDIPRDKFPPGAWQTDVEYLKDWLDQGIKLVDRAMEAILSEYGHGKKDESNMSFEERSEMFQMLIYDLKDEKGPQPGKDGGTNGGWTTEESFEGLVRRVLHSLMTNDSFNVILGGHSAAAGHGNHLKQSYIMQFHKIMEPVFALLDVPLLSRNVARGGLGTLQDSLGFRDMYGEDIDVLIWDSGMTEGRDVHAVDIFYRQGLISGNRVPYLLDGGGSKEVLSYYNANANADVGTIGSGMIGIPECVDEIQCEKLAYATRYMKCSVEAASLCNANKFHSNCWVERDDFTPETKQQEKPGSQVRWHPGFRSHQIEGRIIAFTVLRAIKHGLEKWQQADKYELPDDAWHVANYYAEIRKKTVESNLDNGCKELPLPSRICDIPMRGRTEFSPRPNPEKTSIVSLVKENENGYKPHVALPNLYTGPDVHNPFLELPEGAIDVQAVVSLGRKFEDGHRRAQEVTSGDNNLPEDHRKMSSIIPGLGWQMAVQRAGYCDGTYNSECGRDKDNACLLSGHNDIRGGLHFGSYSGWLVMTLPAIEHGIIIAKVEDWHSEAESSITKGWTSIDNKGRRQLRGNTNTTESIESRELKAAPPEICENFSFEFAIDGKITTWNKARYSEERKVAQRVVEVMTLLDDPKFTESSKDVELAIRMTGCGDSSKIAFLFTHIYFA